MNEGSECSLSQLFLTAYVQVKVILSFHREVKTMKDRIYPESLVTCGHMGIRGRCLEKEKSQHSLSETILFGFVQPGASLFFSPDHCEKAAFLPAAEHHQ